MPGRILRRWIGLNLYNNLSSIKGYCQGVGNLVSTQFRVHMAVGAEPTTEEEIGVERQYDTSLWIRAESTREKDLR